jgi:hypothetical protein
MTRELCSELLGQDTNVLKLKLAKQISDCPTVRAAKAGIQEFLSFLDTGSR